MLDYILVFLLSILGALIQAITGFGYGIFVMSFFPLFLPAFSAAAISTLASLFLAVCIGWRFRRHINLRLVAAPIVFYFLSNAISVYLSSFTPDAFLKRLLGGFLILLAIYFTFFDKKIRLRAGLVTGSVAGLLSGLFGGFFGMGGPPIVLYLLSCTDDNEEYMGTIQFYFFTTNLYSVVMRALNGAYTPQVFSLSGAALVALLLGATVGNLIFKRLNAANMRRLVYLFMILTGAFMLIKG